jgi:hypothetical protein
MRGSLIINSRVSESLRDFFFQELVITFTTQIFCAKFILTTDEMLLSLISKKLIEILFYQSISEFSITPCYQNYFVVNKVVLIDIWKKEF